MTQLSKYIAEARTYSFDFSSRTEIVNGDTIASVGTITCAPTGLTIGSPSISGSKVNVTISGGSTTINYTLECPITTSSGAVLVCAGALAVQA